MSPNGYLQLFREDDGDIIIAVGQGSPDGKSGRTASVQICTVGSGGGKSPRTHKALIQLLGAMAEDNLDPTCQPRQEMEHSVEELQTIVDWVAAYNTPVAAASLVLYKVVGISNYDNESVSDTLDSENLTMEQAETRCQLLNRGGSHNKYHYVPKPQNYVLYTFKP